MNQRWWVGIALVVVIASAPVGWAAHQGRGVASNPGTMFVEGTITELNIDATNSTLKLMTLENRMETLVINPTTAIIGSDGKQAAGDVLRIGQRATIQYVEDHGRQVATSITLLSPQQPAAASLSSQPAITTPAPPTLPASVDTQRTSNEAGEQ